MKSIQISLSPSARCFLAVKRICTTFSQSTDFRIRFSHSAFNRTSRYRSADINNSTAVSVEILSETRSVYKYSSRVVKVLSGRFYSLFSWSTIRHLSISFLLSGGKIMSDLLQTQRTSVIFILAPRAVVTSVYTTHASQHLHPQNNMPMITPMMKNPRRVASIQ